MQGARTLAQHLRALVAPAKDSAQSPAPTVWLTPSVILAPGALTPSPTLMFHVCMHTFGQNTHAYKINKSKTV